MRAPDPETTEDEDFKFYAGSYNRDYLNMETYGPPPAPAGLRYYWWDDALGGAHEYGDCRIEDARTGNAIFACDSDADAEKLCELLTRLAPEEEWES